MLACVCGGIIEGVLGGLVLGGLFIWHKIRGKNAREQ